MVEIMEQKLNKFLTILFLSALCNTISGAGLQKELKSKRVLQFDEEESSNAKSKLIKKDEGNISSQNEETPLYLTPEKAVTVDYETSEENESIVVKIKNLFRAMDQINESIEERKNLFLADPLENQNERAQFQEAAINLVAIKQQLIYEYKTNLTIVHKIQRKKKLLCKILAKAFQFPLLKKKIMAFNKNIKNKINKGTLYNQKNMNKFLNNKMLILTYYSSIKETLNKIKIDDDKIKTELTNYLSKLYEIFENAVQFYNEGLYA